MRGPAGGAGGDDAPQRQRPGEGVGQRHPRSRGDPGTGGAAARPPPRPGCGHPRRAGHLCTHISPQRARTAAKVTTGSKEHHGDKAGRLRRSCPGSGQGVAARPPAAEPAENCTITAARSAALTPKTHPESAERSPAPRQPPPHQPALRHGAAGAASFRCALRRGSSSPPSPPPDGRWGLSYPPRGGSSSPHPPRWELRAPAPAPPQGFADGGGGSDSPPSSAHLRGRTPPAWRSRRGTCPVHEDPPRPAPNVRPRRRREGAAVARRTH
ncbi:skin secretory protein xP2 [Heliangelus exortis]|uniref:skin secretory protein xP2 n=1 Tax=Heliangelus exortis TaxID=472823 RepID=UPI003A94B1C0